ncbi:MAG: 4-hydroxy-tetrahydrodipicolinate synthase [Bacteroidaceae bacterium]|nr:4-hydroxy-tetrahydrodipicolinate synthase [Bacteroidaceae bacterium]
MMNNIFTGLGVALVTPFKKDFTIDFDALAALLEKQVEGGADFLCVLGSTAETPCLSVAEKLQVKDFVIEQIKGRLPLLLGFGGNCTQELLHEVRDFDFKGIDGILSVCPFYNKPVQEGIYQHFKAVATEAGLPVVVYNVPGRTGINMSAATTLRLARDVENIVAVKEASGNVAQIDEIIAGAPDGFEVISGDDAITSQLIQTGATGVISVIGNALPREFGAMVHAALSRKADEANTLDGRLQPFYPLLSVDGNPAGIKAMMSLMGEVENVLRLPLVPARRETVDALAKALQLM